MNKAILLLASLVSLQSAFAGDPSEADRKAILAMAGEFKVDFEFTETLSLQNGYERKTDPYTEEAHELVLVVEDTPRRIFLQHLLAVGDQVIKHWGQIWTWEDTRICEFQGDRTWAIRELTPEQAAGTWSQFVTSVDDSPRYEGWGKWEHQGDSSQWTSNETPRPLPRRENTKRKDYQILAGYNRHTLTPSGWAHEQDNTKVQIRDGKHVPLARESGLNTYTRITGYNFQPAREFWSREGQFWSSVAAGWASIQDRNARFTIGERIDMPSIRKAADELRIRQQEEMKLRMADLIGGSLGKAPEPAAGTANR